MPTPSTIHDGTSERFRTMVRSLSGMCLTAAVSAVGRGSSLVFAADEARIL